VLTGHEVCADGQVEIPERHRRYFELITRNPDIFPEAIQPRECGKGDVQELPRSK